MLGKRAYTALLLCAALFHFMMGYCTDRADPFQVIGLFLALWAVFFIQRADQPLRTRDVLLMGMAFRLIYLMAVPELSDDVFRYIWDGRLLDQGISPYQMTPDQLIGSSIGGTFKDIFRLLNSSHYYSIYPPVLQFIFGASAWIAGGDAHATIIVLRVFVLMAELISMLTIVRLLRVWKIDERNLMLYALNPLVIIEFAGSLHGEVFMVCFILLSLWWLTSGKQFYAALAFGLAISAKLLPLMFLPFLIRRIGWLRTGRFVLIASAAVVLLYLPFYHADLIPHTLSSLRLYFSKFEFNASLYYLIRAIGFWVKGYNIIGLTAVVLPPVALLAIAALAVFDKKRDVSSLPERMMFAWCIYYALSTTVNPWYVAVLAMFLPFVRYRFGLLWLLLIPLSYSAFAHKDFHEQPFILIAEYLPVYLWLLFELGLLYPVRRWWAVRKALVKHARLRPYIQDTATLFDIGSGNGALAMLLGRDGIKVTALDVVKSSIFSDIDVRIYDGKRFPFVDQQADVCQLITMLHHTDNAKQLLAEAGRVARKVIVMEDVYHSGFQKYLTWATDSLVNWEFYGHPHSNRTDKEWRELFKMLGFRVADCSHHRFLLFFSQITYLLEKE